MAFYTEPRFTKDIDVLVLADDYTEIQDILSDFGYFESITPWTERGWKVKRIDRVIRELSRFHDFGKKLKKYSLSPHSPAPHSDYRWAMHTRG